MGSDLQPLTQTIWERQDRYDLNHMRAWSRTPSDDNIFMRISWLTVSKIVILRPHLPALHSHIELAAGNLCSFPITRTRPLSRENSRYTRGGARGGGGGGQLPPYDFRFLFFNVLLKIWSRSDFFQGWRKHFRPSGTFCPPPPPNKHPGAAPGYGWQFIPLAIAKNTFFSQIFSGNLQKTPAK